MDATTLLEIVVDRLRKQKDNYAEISRRSGISYSSLTKLAQGATSNPTVDTLQKVIEALDAFEASLPGAPPVDPTVEPFEAAP